MNRGNKMKIKNFFKFVKGKFTGKHYQATYFQFNQQKKLWFMFVLHGCTNGIK